MDEGRRQIFKSMAASFLEAAEAKHLKWNSSTWTKARYLLGVLCSEERRGFFAAELLSIMGFEAQLEGVLHTF